MLLLANLVLLKYISTMDKDAAATVDQTTTPQYNVTDADADGPTPQ